METNINMRVSNLKPFTGKNLSGNRHPSLEPAIQFYKLEDNNTSDSGYEVVIHIKIY